MTAVLEANPNAVVLLEVDPKGLASHPANIRKAEGDLTDLTASIRELGVLQPIVVSALDDGYKIHFGHRRTAASIKAELRAVPIVVIPEGSTAGDVFGMLAENVHRKNLTPAEEGAAYLQLQAEGLDVEAIAKGAGVDAARVSSGITVAGSKVVATTERKHDLTLEQSLVLAEFETNKAAIRELTSTLAKDPGQFDHVASRARQEAEANRLYDELVTKLKADGVKILPPDTNTWGASAPTALEELVDDKRKTITPAGHKGCPGHAVIIRRYSSRPKAVFVCTAATKHGHKSRYGSSSTTTATPKAADMTDAQRVKAKAERRAVIENNKAWKAATPVRLEFVTKLVRRRAAPKGTLRYAVAEITSDPTWIDQAQHNILDGITGHSSGGYGDPDSAGVLASKGTDGQLPLALVAMVAAAAETTFHNLNRPYDDTRPALRRYLEFLRDAGYELAPVEELILPKATKVKPPAKKAAKT